MKLSIQLMHIGKIGIAAVREGAQQIERRRGLAVGLDLPPRIGRARGLRVNSMPLTMSPR